MNWFFLVLLGLATFRLTRLLVYDKITAFIRAPFHEIREEVNSEGSMEHVLYVKGTGIRAFLGELLSCHWCTGVWCAIVLYLGSLFFPAVFHPIAYILAIAAIGALLEEKLN